MTSSDTIRIFATAASWLEGEALRQLERVAGLPGMVRVAAYPDLHPGKGGPVGAAMLAEGIFYPDLVGAAGGCGMAYPRVWKIADDGDAGEIAGAGAGHYRTAVAAGDRPGGPG